MSASLFRSLRLGQSAAIRRNSSPVATAPCRFLSSAAFKNVSSKRVVAIVISGTVAGGVTLYYINKPSLLAESTQKHNYKLPALRNELPTRAEMIQNLKTKDFDVLIIGGGASGAGVALDSATRGLETALIELDDYASGTSSRSTKLIHGGVRYLQKAIMRLDREQYRMVKEALHERRNLLEIAPHLTTALPILLPVYKYWQIPYYYAGIKAYDLVSGSKLLKPSYIMFKNRTLDVFPMLKKDRLKCGIVYYDGQQNDARMNMSLIVTAIRYGTECANHTKVTQLLKNDQGKVCGAVCKDLLSGEEFKVNAKCVVNATGPFTDSIRQMGSDKFKPICQPSSGVHIILPDYYSPDSMGLLDPETSDGRVIFFLPWQNHTIAGTTDLPCEPTFNPKPSEAEISFILDEVRHYLSPDVQVRRGDVRAAWSGIRPLVKDPSKGDTQSLARNHIVEVDDTNLVTLAGGKWTTYRSMAIHTVDAAIKACQLEPKLSEASQTDGLFLEGGEGWTPNFYIRLVQDFGLDTEVARHLSETYGTKSIEVAKLARATGERWPLVGKRIVSNFPYLEAEVQYAMQEYAETVTDVLARRTRIAFLNTQSAQEAIPKIADLMAKKLKWSKDRKASEIKAAQQFVSEQMGAQARKDYLASVPVSLTSDEINRYKSAFNNIDRKAKGFISLQDLRQFFKDQNEEISEATLRDILNDVDANSNGQLELEEFLQTF
ncbi:glycerol-3-phosphate dehydrogenase, mitochondrial-like isoform X2 [Convolutriloba macropyga]|uniref:glycerol-3-phosphate dehydrogenase, mitochondrial-like isoform X2 n=1 Tax=Convolutriloba macropyga TaxID=536237 RepID=UPI003F51F83C